MGSLELYDMFLMSDLLGQYHGTINAGMSVFDTTHISNITLTVRDLVVECLVKMPAIQFLRHDKIRWVHYGG